MGSGSSSRGPWVWVALLLHTVATVSALETTYYDTSCPEAQSIVQSTLASAFASNPRIAASILRLHFHDCFVNGCDGSNLLKDTPTFTGEQSAPPNLNSALGFDVVDDIKSAVESACPGVVSCADILAIAARDGVVLTGGPTWAVNLGRRDSLTASLQAAANDIPPPFGNVATLKQFFANLGLAPWDLVTLSGAHTIGKARCVSVNQPGNSRLYDWSENSDLTSGSGLPDPNINSGFLASLQSLCPQFGDGNVTTFLDVQTGLTFDNAYFTNLQAYQGLLNSDQALYYQDPETQSIVDGYAADQNSFFEGFSISIVTLGDLNPLEYPNGEVRTQCGYPN